MKWNDAFVPSVGITNVNTIPEIPVHSEVGETMDFTPTHLLDTRPILVEKDEVYDNDD